MIDNPLAISQLKQVSCFQGFYLIVVVMRGGTFVLQFLRDVLAGNQQAYLVLFDNDRIPGERGLLLEKSPPWIPS